MDVTRKLAILADAAKYDASCASSGSKRERLKDGIGNVTGNGICHSYAPDGRCISLLKILLTNYCIYDCQFCINRVSSATERARFTAKEVVDLTLEFYRRNYIEGLFLSSGIIQSIDYTMEQLCEVARSLRDDHKYNGYIHLKTIPGASPELLERAGRLADRLSANVELPRQLDLDRVAPAKKHSVIENSMTAVRELIDESRAERRIVRSAPKMAPAGQSTQMIVGATEATDRDILLKASALYQRFDLKRIYYSAFSPIPDSAPGLPAFSAPLVREHRLYQSDWMLRFYGFTFEEIVTENEPDLPLDIDPKVHWALKNRGLFPLDVNRADRRKLLRVPGFGVRTVNRIIQSRRFHALRFEDLVRMKVPLSRAKYFITVPGQLPNTATLDSERLSALLRPVKKTQLSLFETNVSAITGEL